MEQKLSRFQPKLEGIDNFSLALARERRQSTGFVVLGKELAGGDREAKEPFGRFPDWARKDQNSGEPAPTGNGHTWRPS
jgi:hypothetical protein